MIGSRQRTIGVTRRHFLAASGTLAAAAVLPAQVAEAVPAVVPGRVLSWGTNGSGQLGLGYRGGARLPRLIPGLSDVKAIGSGYDSGFALDAKGTLFSWGVFALGRDYTGEDYTRAGRVVGLPPMLTVKASDNHALGVARDGSVWAWGRNNHGQLGDGTTRDRALPGVVRGLSGVVAVAAAQQTSVALTSSGQVYTWGDGSEGTLGNGYYESRTPAVVPRLGAVIAIAASRDHVLCVLDNGSVWGWGDNVYGPLGNGRRSGSEPRPVQAAGITQAIAVATNDGGSLSLNANGRVKQWGAPRGNLIGQFVHELDSISAVASGGETNYALRTDGRVMAWGDNLQKELGRPSPNSSLRPLVVPGLADVRAITAGTQHALALT